MDSRYLFNRVAIQRAQEASASASEVRGSAREIAQDLERLFMVTQALWEILKEQHGYTDEELALRVQEIDLRDGNLDGKNKSVGVKDCPFCNRKLQGKHQRCLYCGEFIARDPFER